MDAGMSRREAGWREALRLHPGRADRARGGPFGEVLRERIFEPLGMKD